MNALIQKSPKGQETSTSVLMGQLNEFAASAKFNASEANGIGWSKEFIVPNSRENNAYAALSAYVLVNTGHPLALKPVVIYTSNDRRALPRGPEAILTGNREYVVSSGQIMSIRYDDAEGYIVNIRDLDDVYGRPVIWTADTDKLERLAYFWSAGSNSGGKERVKIQNFFQQMDKKFDQPEVGNRLSWSDYWNFTEFSVASKSSNGINCVHTGEREWGVYRTVQDLRRITANYQKRRLFIIGPMGYLEAYNYYDDPSNFRMNFCIDASWDMAYDKSLFGKLIQLHSLDSVKLVSDLIALLMSPGIPTTPDKVLTHKVAKLDQAVMMQLLGENRRQYTRDWLMEFKKKIRNRMECN